MASKLQKPEREALQPDPRAAREEEPAPRGTELEMPAPRRPGSGAGAIEELEQLVELLAEVGRLELDLLVRDQSTSQAVLTLQALREELTRILDRASRVRRACRQDIHALEDALEESWPGSRAGELLRELASARRLLAGLDADLVSAQVMAEELERRCHRRASVAGLVAGSDEPGPDELGHGEVGEVQLAPEEPGPEEPGLEEPGLGDSPGGEEREPTSVRAKGRGRRTVQGRSR